MVKEISRSELARSTTFASLEERFWDSIQYEPNSGCWLWFRQLARRGYGRFRNNQRFILAHRYSYELHKGPIPDGMYVCHHCDTPACVNPLHLFAGTPKDNMVDMCQKGRNADRTKEKHPLVRLTQIDINEIRRRRISGEGNNALAREFGISYGHCSNICNHKKTWL